MKFKRTLREELSINITPLIDVVFLLLIFFMLTTTFSRETRLLINLPEANADIAESQSPQIEITVAREGSYTINGRALINRRIETLMRGLELESGGDLNCPDHSGCGCGSYSSISSDRHWMQLANLDSHE